MLSLLTSRTAQIRTEFAKGQVKSFKSGNYSDDKDDRYELIDFFIIEEDITPKAQLLDSFLDKIMKGFYKVLCDTHMINTPVNLLTGYPFILSRQLCVTWVVSTWEQVPKALVKKAWVAGNYVAFEKLQK